MADSKFIKYQDKNGDGLNDACEDIVKATESPSCDSCKPDPSYLSPNWKNKKNEEPWYDAKRAEFRVTITTKEKRIIPNTGASDRESDKYIQEIYEKYKDEAIENLLIGFNKIDTEAVRTELREVIQYQKYDLEPRNNSYLKLLYGVPCNHFFGILSIIDPNADVDDEEEEITASGDITVRYNASTLAPKLLKFRKAMNLYARYYRVHTALENVLLVEDNGKVFTVKQFDRYGDNGVFGKSRMYSILNTLDSWLNDRDLNIHGIGGLSGIGKNRVKEIEFVFSSEYRLKKMKVFTVSCGTIPIRFGKKRLKTLNKSKGWEDPRACAYFTRLDAMENDLGAREPKPWIEFVEEYTFPKVSATANFGIEPRAGIVTCVTDILLAEGKQLGQDILDEVFSLGDAVAYSFNKKTCYPDQFDVEEMQKKLGLLDSKNEFAEGKAFKKPNNKNILNLAMDQAFKELKEDDQIFVELCERIVRKTTGIGTAPEIGDLWVGGFDRIGLCGFKDMATDTMKCLMNGLPLEKALSAIIIAALNGLSIENLNNLLIGLPPEKQQELAILIDRKMKANDLVTAESLILDNKEEASTEEVITVTRTSRVDGETVITTGSLLDDYNPEDSEATVGATIANPPPEQPSNIRTLAQRYDDATNNNGLDKNRILQAYIAALIEVYSEDLLSLVDRLNRFPGAQMIARVIALFDCPKPPMFEPNFLDFVKSIDVPFCKEITPITLPKLINPSAWIPARYDYQAVIFEVATLQIQKIIIATIVKIIVKICELLGDAICKALATVGELAASLPDIAAGRETVSEIIRESICGPDTPQEQVDDTITDMFAKFGVGGAAFSNPEDVLSLMGDISSSNTRRELMSALSGDMSRDMGERINNLIEFEYPQFRSGLSNSESIRDMFGDFGNLLPVDVRESMSDFLNNLPEDDFLPANPSLCATPEQIEDFCALRVDLLNGRATTEQVQLMCSNAQDDMFEDLLDIANATQGSPLENIIPPIFSDPGCSNGLLPFETEESKKAAGLAIGSGLEQLKIDFAKDMIGNGPGEKNWGMMNMILSDTMGQPLTAHWRKSGNRLPYVDFITDSDAPEEGSFLGLFSDPPPTFRQYGALPAEVAIWLKNQIEEMEFKFNSKNTFISDVRYAPKTFREAGINQLYGDDPDLLSLGDLGYNIEYQVNSEEKTITLIRKGSKHKPDITLSFKDNNKGRREHDNTEFLYGFNVNMFMSELEKVDDTISNIGVPTKPVDSTRIKIVELFNSGESGGDAITESMSAEQAKEYNKSKRREKSVIKNTLYDFLSTEDTLSGFENRLSLRRYNSFTECFKSKKEFMPQLYLLSDILSLQETGGSSVANLKEFHDNAMNSILSSLRDEITSNTAAFSYGAQYDNLTSEMYDYVVDAGQTDSPAGTLYGDATINGEKIANEDGVLGVSRDQLENGNDARIYYLSPTTYGGKYVNPAIYVKPVKSEGWVGLLDVLFPEFTPCKPRSADLINFGEIEQEISEVYASIAEDQRLKSDPDCIYELPYNRILERSSKANIQGIIRAACRIYGSANFIKSFATFTTFYPKFTENYSSIYSHFIMEEMQTSFRDAQSAGWEFFNPFKDDEFWYAFLEQSVQTYGRLVDEGKIIDPPQPVLDALFRINDAQEKYNYPYRSDLRKAKRSGEITLLRTLKSYRSENNLEAVMATENDAKVILKEFITTELNKIGEVFINNLKLAGFNPKYTDLGYYFMTNLSQGGLGLSLDKEIKEQYIGLPTEGEDHFTAGQELALPDGTEYKGYYHVEEGENDTTLYVEGAFSTRNVPGEAQSELTIFDTKVSVPIGDIQDYGAGFNTGETSRSFLIEKYVKIDGAIKTVANALSIITANDPGNVLSDIYPGTLEHVLSPDGDSIVGIKGELGVRHGLQFSAIIRGSKHIITNVEIDALDVSVGEYIGIPANSRLLLCLINHLKEDDTFKLCTEYIFPVNKSLSLLAIYNNLGFLSSIGEVTVQDGDTKPSITSSPDFDDKPGAKVTFPDIDDGDATPNYDDSVEAWSSYDDRNRLSPFVNTWDEWDRVLLRNSKSRIKKLFKTYYNSRDFDPTNTNSDYKPADIIINNLRAAIKRPTSARLPFFNKRRLRPNVFNKDGKMCDKKE
tara:strand:+ start:2176 stop:8550 length:6375 start_codon:yes stop_codon:yes gene_type:complete